MDLRNKEANEAGAKGGEGTGAEVSDCGLLGQQGQQGLKAIGRTLAMESLGMGQKSERVLLGFRKSGVVVLTVVWGRDRGDVERPVQRCL